MSAPEGIDLAALERLCEGAAEWAQNRPAERPVEVSPEEFNELLQIAAPFPHLIRVVRAAVEAEPKIGKVLDGAGRDWVGEPWFMVLRDALRPFTAGSDE